MTASALEAVEAEMRGLRRRRQRSFLTFQSRGGRGGVRLAWRMLALVLETLSFQAVPPQLRLGRVRVLLEVGFQQQPVQGWWLRLRRHQPPQCRRAGAQQRAARCRAAQTRRQRASASLAEPAASGCVLPADQQCAHRQAPATRGAAAAAAASGHHQRHRRCEAPPGCVRAAGGTWWEGECYEEALVGLGWIADIDCRPLSLALWPEKLYSTAEFNRSDTRRSADCSRARRAGRPWHSLSWSGTRSECPASCRCGPAPWPGAQTLAA